MRFKVDFDNLVIRKIIGWIKTITHRRNMSVGIRTRELKLSKGWEPWSDFKRKNQYWIEKKKK